MASFFDRWAGLFRAVRQHSATGVDFGVTPGNLYASLGTVVG